MVKIFLGTRGGKRRDLVGSLAGMGWELRGGRRTAEASKTGCDQKVRSRAVASMGLSLSPHLQQHPEEHRTPLSNVIVCIGSGSWKRRL